MNKPIALASSADRSADIPVRLGASAVPSVKHPAEADRNVRAPNTISGQRRLTTTAALVGLLLLLALPARADYVQTFDSGFQNGGLVPDNSKSGWADTRTVPSLSGAISDVSVVLNLSGGWNGDLYAYLVHDTGFAVLLNRVGRETGNAIGYGDSGMNVVFNDVALGGDIHWYGGTGVPAGSYQPDGRNILPQSAVGTFDAAERTAWLSSFIGGNASGNWTLYVADVAGGEQSTVSSWGLDITTASVPEPTSLIGGAVAVLFLGGAIGWYRRKESKPGSA